MFILGLPCRLRLNFSSGLSPSLFLTKFVLCVLHAFFQQFKFRPSRGTHLQKVGLPERKLGSSGIFSTQKLGTCVNGAVVMSSARRFFASLHVSIFFRHKVKSATFDENLPVGLQVNILDSHKVTTLYIYIYIYIYIYVCVCVCVCVCVFCQCACLHGLP